MTRRASSVQVCGWLLAWAATGCGGADDVAGAAPGDASGDSPAGSDAGPEGGDGDGDAVATPPGGDEVRVDAGVGPGGGNGEVGCLRDSDCGEGAICEGQGCGDGAPGACVPEVRPCTRDLRPYCGCDGQTFSSSGTCPGRRYASTGSCAEAQPELLAGSEPTDGAGAAGEGGAGDENSVDEGTESGAGTGGAGCLTSSDCGEGRICEGQGCSAQQPGACVQDLRSCTFDLVTYCGCDGQTFSSSGTCPGRRYVSEGPCS